HAGLAAAHVTCPSLFLVAPDDEMAGAAPVVTRDVYDRLTGPKEWVEIEGGHFGLLFYPGDIYTRSSVIQAEFLVRTLRPAR
ncbi:MAG TPA: hypothetical protein VFJ13_02215, partial [Paracoccaceae bacterium]|nr:hypothetical protein [Paracoccaceae bacterium]